MKSVESFFEKLQSYGDNKALIYKDSIWTYAELLNKVSEYQHTFLYKIRPGDVVLFISDYSPETIAIFFALALKSAVVVLIRNAPVKLVEEYANITQANFKISVTQEQLVEYEELESAKKISLIESLREKNHPGLVIMSSGSTGKSKAVLHDLSVILANLKESKKKLSLISSLGFDHIGGIDAILRNLYSGNTIVIPQEVNLGSICNAIQNHQVNLLIASPSFLNFLVIANTFSSYNLKSLTQINYGGEVMPASLLETLNQRLPGVKFKQGYGLSELGVIQTVSESPYSLRIKINDRNAQFRIRDSKLEIKSDTSMLGYLNASDPFIDDGWFATGDVVEIEGDYLRILGRDSEIINVGGKKVFPVEIESILLKMPEVADALVSSEPHPLLGKIIIAKIKLKEKLMKEEFIKRMYSFCQDYLPRFKVPQKIVIVEQIDYGDRLKKMRKG